VSGLWNYYDTHASTIWGWIWTTVWLAAVPLIIGLLLALPLGWLANRYRFTYLPTLTIAGILYTIPSIVLFLVLPGVLGTKVLQATNIAVALTIYTVALMVRIVADGLGSVAAETMAAASAMGYTSRQRFFAVQLPVAVPVIGAGMRVAAVSNVSLVSVASTIGVTQLGSLFIEGNNNYDTTPILLGLILFVVLAFVFDGVVLSAVRVLTPWQRAVRAR
jgi:osmoprotectant transport system permease protein